MTFRPFEDSRHAASEILIELGSLPIDLQAEIGAVLLHRRRAYGLANETKYPYVALGIRLKEADHERVELASNPPGSTREALQLGTVLALDFQKAVGLFEQRLITTMHIKQGDARTLPVKGGISTHGVR